MKNFHCLQRSITSAARQLVYLDNAPRVTKLLPEFVRCTNFAVNNDLVSSNRLTLIPLDHHGEACTLVEKRGRDGGARSQDRDLDGELNVNKH